MLGAGFVTKPTLDILSDAGIEVTVGTCCFPHLTHRPSPDQRGNLGCCAPSWTWPLTTYPPPTCRQTESSPARANTKTLATAQPAGPSTLRRSSPQALPMLSPSPSTSTTRRPLTLPSASTTSLSPSYPTPFTQRSSSPPSAPRSMSSPPATSAPPWRNWPPRPRLQASPS